MAFQVNPSKVHARVLPIREPGSPFLDAYRRLYRKILYLQKQGELQSIGVTSSQESEGKTLTSINLALVMAEDATKKVALLDCDFRKPQVARYLGLPEVAPGLAEVMRNEKNLGDIMVPVGLEGRAVQLFPAGRIRGEPAPSLYSSQLAPLLRDVKNAFDLVIVDNPPILPVADEEFLADLLDGVLLVVRAGKTARDQVVRAIECLEGKNILGVLFNGLEKAISGYGYYGYYYGSYQPDKPGKGRRAGGAAR